jgi:hypothetical protein
MRLKFARVTAVCTAALGHTAFPQRFRAAKGYYGLDGRWQLV